MGQGKEVLAALALQWWYARNVTPVLTDERQKLCPGRRTCSWLSLQLHLPTQGVVSTTCCSVYICHSLLLVFQCFLLRSQKSRNYSLGWVHLNQHIYERWNPDKMLVKREIETNNKHKTISTLHTLWEYSMWQLACFRYGFASWLSASLCNCGHVTERYLQSQ